MATKVYRSKRYINDGVKLVEKDKEGKVVFSRTCEFNGGESAPRWKGGVFVTADSKVQKLLENHPEFNSRFGLDRVSDESGEPEVEEKNVSKLVTEQALKQVPGIDKFQLANNWLRDNINPKPDYARSTAKVIEVAAAHGIVFPDLAQ